MASTSNNKMHIEVEGKEIMIKSNDGYNAIIPKHGVKYVKSALDKGDYAAVDEYVKKLPKL